MKLKTFLLGCLALMSFGWLLSQPLTALDCQSSDLSPGDRARCAVQAVDPDGQTQDSQNQISHVLSVVLEILGWVIGVASVIMLVVQGLRLVLSGGNKEVTVQVRNSIIYVVVGIAISVSSLSIVHFVLNRIEG